jgi:hypothetical protein
MRIRIFPALLLTTLAVLPACEQNKGVYPPNQAPRTYLSVVGDSLSTTDYRKILNWWGTDLDGAISGYLVRWNGGWAPPDSASMKYNGETYEFTTATLDTFAVPLGGTQGVRRFTVRAVDGAGLVDPVGVTQSFPLSNNAPSLVWDPAIPRPTESYPAVAFGFRPTDFDGRSTVSHYRLWFDDDSLEAWTVTDTIVGVYPEDFGPDHTTRPRTIHVRAYDDARAPSNTVSHTWTVRWPQSDWLLISQIHPQALGRWDRDFYSAVLDSTIGPGYDIIDMYTGPEFSTSEEIGPLFHLFKGVLWLTGPYVDANEKKMVRNLKKAEPAIREYMEDGGRMILVGQSILGTGGGLSYPFADEVLGISEFYQRQPDPETYDTNIPMSQSVLYQEADGDTAQLAVYNIPNFVDYSVAPHSPGTGRYWVAPGALRNETGNPIVPDQTSDPAYCAVVSTYGSGRITVVTTSYARLYDVLRNPAWRQTIGEGIRLFEEALRP